MKAMLEPRIAAARIHGPAAGWQGAPAGPDAIDASSQGCLRIVPIAPKHCAYLYRSSVTIRPDERPVPQILERLFYLFSCVHDEWTIPRDRLCERFRGNEQEANRIVGRRYCDVITVSPHNQLCL
jgi:hypothetical protein